MVDRPRGMRWRSPFALAVAALGHGLVANWANAAEPVGYVALEWVAPAECPDGAVVGKELDRLLAGASVAGAPYLRARAEVRQASLGVWAVELRTTGPQGPGLRVVTAESCRALADATALILALAVDPGRVAANHATETPATPTVPNEVQPPSPLPTPAVKPPLSRSSVPSSAAQRGREASLTARPLPPKLRSPRWGASTSAVLDFGTLPYAAPGLGGKVSGVPSAHFPLRIELGANVFFDQERASPAAQSGTFSYWTLDAGGCTDIVSDPLEAGVCATAELAWIHAGGLYETVTSQGTAAWLVARARTTVAYRLSTAWALRADVGLGYDVSRPEFVSSGAGPGLIHQPERITGRTEFGLEFRF